MTVAVRDASMVYRSSEEAKPSVAQLMLEPLLTGKPVVLYVDDPKAPKRKRAKQVRLFLTPGEAIGGVDGLVVGYETHGCEVVDTSRKIDPISFYRLGLSVRLSKAIVNELNLLYGRKP